MTDVEREDEEIRALKEEHQKVFDDMLRLTEIISSPKFGVSKKPEVAEVLNGAYEMSTLYYSTVLVLIFIHCRHPSSGHRRGCYPQNRTC